MKKYRVGIVGAGNICQSAHLPAYATMKDLVEVVAIADIDRLLAESAAEKFGIPAVYGSVEELLAGTEVDYIDCCVWTAAHAPVVIAAAKAGKDILCEKPLAATLEQGLAMQEAVREAGVKFMLAVVTRYGNEQLKVHEMQENGEFGDIYYAKTSYMRRRGTPGGWFTDRELAGGGPVLDIGVHCIDRTWFLMGRPKPVTVSAEVSYRIGDYQTKGVSRWCPLSKSRGIFNTEDSAVVFIRFEGGVVMSAEIAWAENGPASATTVLYGSKAGCTFEPLTVFTEDANGYLADMKPDLKENNIFEEEIRHFLTCLREGSEPLSPMEDAVTVQRMLDAIYRSAGEHREITL